MGKRHGYRGIVLGLLVAAWAPGVRADRSDVVAKPDFRGVISEATEKVFPAVVFIKCVRQSHESGKKSSEEVAGSGVLISPDGQVVTNWHVVDKAIEVRCLLHDGKAFDAKVLGTDKDTDLAVLQLAVGKDDGELAFSQLGDSTVLRPGDFVMAMGAPWGLSRSVTIGIVSCTNRYLETNSQYSLWLQTDAAISPGNSGGPLVNTAGEVVGITALGSLIGGDMGFAVPAETVAMIVSQIRAHGRVQWSWTGLQLQPIRDFGRNIYFDATEGVIVAETDPQSPARRAGIEPRDRIVRVNSQRVVGMTEEDLPGIRRMLGLLTMGEPATFEIVRDGQTMTVQLTPRAKGDVEGNELDCPRWDMTVKEINQFDNPNLYFHRKQGVFVYGVKYPGNASNAELRQHDILLKVDNRPVLTLDDVRAIHKAALGRIDANPRVVFTVLRNGLMRQVVLDFSRDYEKD